ncbi:MAG: FAD-dependent oxidoreductase [Deltaproteobacteria bacterium]|jgi:succinate dehydrogenase/fumarate reductase flavoprotein subunit|nr:FAD-dependent oxidoreductase [Deltaproteobacteria bacterium]
MSQSSRNLQSAHPIPRSSIDSWDDEADVLIVGYGGAGACAAIESARASADTLVLERASGGGGTTAMAAGHIYLGGGTRVQRACGYEDSAENLLRYLEASADDPDEDKFRLYAEGSVAHFEWLESLGVPFKDSIHEARTNMQQTDECLLWSGNEKAWPFCEIATPAPRGHKVAKEGDAGPLLFEKLHAAATEAGARIQYDTRVLTLIVEDDGSVAGLVARCAGEERRLRARRGVILCAGGYAMDEAMFARHIPRLAGRVLPIGNPYDDGAGLRMGLGARGAGIHLADYHITLPFYPPASLTYGIFVNAQGQRFVAEDAYHGRIGELASRQPQGTVYLIVDEPSFRRPEIEGFELAATEGSIEDLEKALDLPRGALVQTVDFYNRHAAEGRDPLLRKQPAWLRPIQDAPFAALECSLGKAPYMAFSLGGLWTKPTGEVLSEDGEVVEGLYAAGRNACGIARSAEGYASGTCIGDATFFGRLAGRAAARRRPGQA